MPSLPCESLAARYVLQSATRLGMLTFGKICANRAKICGSFADIRCRMLCLCIAELLVLRSLSLIALSVLQNSCGDLAAEDQEPGGRLRVGDPQAIQQQPVGVARRCCQQALERE
jgi:hypothetical protein